MEFLFPKRRRRLNKLSKFLVQRAAALLESGQWVEALAPLQAAAFFGGGDLHRQASVWLAWRWADRAEAAFQAGRREETLRCASLSCVAADTVKAFYFLCRLFEREDPKAVAALAARIEAEADPVDQALRQEAARLRRQALEDLRLEEAPARDMLAARLSLIRADLDAALAGDRLAEAEGFFAALSSLAPEDPETQRLLGYFDQRRREAYYAALAAGEAEEAFAQLALLVALTQEFSAFDKLIEEANGHDDMALVESLTERRLALTDPESAAWRGVDLRRRIARLRLDGMEPALAEQEARRAAVEALESDLEARPDDSQLRYFRFSCLLSLQRYRQAIEDLQVMIAAAQADPETDPGFARLLAMQALYLLKSVRYPETAWAVRQVMLDPPTDPRALFDLYGYLTDASAVPAAREIARRIAPTTAAFGVFELMQDFVADLDRAPAAQFGRAPAGKRLIYVSQVCWGAKYVALMESSLASLLAPGNFPALAAQADLVLEVVTGAADASSVAASPALRRLAEICQIRVIALPDHPDFCEWAKQLPYVVFGHATHFTILRARRDGADLLCLNPDVIYADGSYASVAARLTDQPRALFSDGLNAAMTPVLAGLEANWRDGALIVDPRSLCALAARHLQQRTTECFYDPQAKRARNYPTRVVFRKPFGLRFHAFYQGPVYVSRAALGLFEPAHFGTSDGGFVEELLDYLRDDEIEQFADSDAYLAVELNDSVGQVYPRADKPLLDCVTELFQHYSGSVRRYQIFRRGVDYFMPGEIDAPLIDDATEREFLAALQDRVDRHPVFAELGAERERIRPKR
jgi:tetratricopeptide (TPR) repeat protein